MKHGLTFPYCFFFFFLSRDRQGGAESYRNTIQLMALFGYEPYWLEMKVSFGQGDQEWNNYADTPIIERHREEIERFGQVEQSSWWELPRNRSAALVCKYIYIYI